MALSKKIKVPVPDHGVIVRHNPKRPYVYKVMRTYRNAKGQPTNDARAIGRLDPEDGMLIPNDAYWELYPDAPAPVLGAPAQAGAAPPPTGPGDPAGPGRLSELPAPGAVRSIGSAFLVSQVLDRLGVSRILADALGADRAEAVATVASYMARRGNAMEGIVDWAETSTLEGLATLSGRDASRLFASITHGERMAFFASWAARLATGAYLAYDVTSFSTYAHGIDDAEWGYNRDHDKLPQINLGAYLDQTTALPVFYTTYPGSIVDKSHLPHMMAHNADLGVTDVTFVMDRGFASTANIAYMHAHHHRFLLGVELRNKAARQAVHSVKDTIVTMRRRLESGVYADVVHGRFWGQVGDLHIFHDPVLAERRRAEVWRKVEAESETLAQLDHLTAAQARPWRAHFAIDLHRDQTFTFAPDMDKIDDAVALAGFFAVLTNTDLDSAQVLATYRRKDAIEKGFDDLKNHIDMKRLRTHTDATTAGKLFCAFIALIATSHIQTNVGPALKHSKQSLSKRDVLAEMDKIKIVDAASGLRLINPATKTQRLILQALNLTETNLTDYATP
jgi:transposase